MSRKAKSAQLTQTRRGISPLWLPVALAAGCVLMFAVLSAGRRTPREIPPLAINRVNVDGAPLMLAEAAELRDDQLERFAIAQLSLLAAQDLPGCEGQDMEKLLAQLDDWTRQVRIETERNMHRFREHPEEYENSEVFYRMGMLITVLQQDFGVRYNPDLIEPSARDTKDTGKDFLTNCANVFVTGVLRDRMGTCASMPVLYVAIARRLGYPVKLVSAKDHLFARWEDGKERRNIEGTGHGIACHSDQHYIEWRSISDAEIKAGWSMKSHSPREELAIFLVTRAGGLRFHKRYDAALVAYAQANRLWPKNPAIEVRFADTIAEAIPSQFTPVKPLPDQIIRALRPRDPFETLREVNALNRQRFP